MSNSDSFPTVLLAGKALVQTWLNQGVELRTIERRKSFRGYEATLHMGEDGIAAVIHFRLKVEQLGRGFFEFGLSLYWPRAYEIRMQVRPPRTPTGALLEDVFPISTLAMTRDSKVFSATSPILFDGATQDDFRKVFEDNRDSFIAHALPRVKDVCSPEGLCRALQGERWIDLFDMHHWMVPMVFAAANAQSLLDAWARENEADDEMMQAIQRAAQSSGGDAWRSRVLCSPVP